MVANTNDSLQKTGDGLEGAKKAMVNGLEIFGLRIVYFEENGKGSWTQCLLNLLRDPNGGI